MALGTGEKKTVTIDVANFVQTRNALNTAFLGLSNSIDKAVKAYIDHTQAVLDGDSTLDLAVLIQPFNTLNAAAIAQQVIAHNGITVPEGKPVRQRKKRTYKPRDPNAPKRPLTAYFRFLREVRPRVIAEIESGEREQGDISKICTAMWNALTKDEQNEYREGYNEESVEYKKAAAEYKAAGEEVDENDQPAEDSKSIVAPAEAEGQEEQEEQDEQEEQEDDEDEDEDDESDEESTDEDEEDEIIALPARPVAAQAPANKLRPFTSTPAPAAAPVAAPAAASAAVPKNAKAATKKAVKAAADPVPASVPAVSTSTAKPRFSSINPVIEPEVTKTEPNPTSSSPVRKRKTPATIPDDAESAPKKRGRRSNVQKAANEAEAAAAAAAAVAAATPAPEPAPVSVPPPTSETKKPKREKKKRKSEPAV